MRLNLYVYYEGEGGNAKKIVKYLNDDHELYIGCGFDNMWTRSLKIEGREVLRIFKSSGIKATLLSFFQGNQLIESIYETKSSSIFI
jgi:hypothetical protein